jgi:hypothetical protein
VARFAVAAIAIANVCNKIASLRNNTHMPPAGMVWRKENSMRYIEAVANGALALGAILLMVEAVGL